MFFSHQLPNTTNFGTLYQISEDGILEVPSRLKLEAI